VEQGLLQVHGWVYEFERGEVLAYDPRVEQFVPLPQAYDLASVRR
jgi:carbonic anhydrase